MVTAPLEKGKNPESYGAHDRTCSKAEKGKCDAASLSLHSTTQYVYLSGRTQGGKCH